MSESFKPVPAAPRSFAAPPAQLDLPRLEHEILQLWQERDIEGRSLRTTTRADGSPRPAFVFYDGPPFATGLPHYGHLLAGTIKDIVPRYWFMRGYSGGAALRLGLPRAADREPGGERARAAREGGHRGARGAALQRGVPGGGAALHGGVGAGRAADGPLGRLSQRLQDHGLLVHGERVVGVRAAVGRGSHLRGVSGAAGVAGAGDPAVELRGGPGSAGAGSGDAQGGAQAAPGPEPDGPFKLEDEDAWLWAWTTTPWTLPSNLALAVHPEVTYVKVRVVDRHGRDRLSRAGSACGLSEPRTRGCDRGAGADARQGAGRAAVRAAAAVLRELQDARGRAALGVPRGRGGVRVDRQRHGRRASGAGLRRGRLPGRSGRGPADGRAGQPERDLRRARHGLRGPVRQGRGQSRSARGSSARARWSTRT
jgi:hypothetical protein